MEKLAPIGAELTVIPHVLIELRFETLEYALIAELRQDSLVDRGRTPQTTASIRIVLGTARELGGLDGSDTTRRLQDGKESGPGSAEDLFWLYSGQNEVRDPSGAGGSR
ncbi:MAG: hypothetical protein WCK73_15605 [Deltaproteobacteria bacterium]